jgi:hypothetical protein
LEDQDIDGKIILKIALNNWDVIAWSGFIASG